MDDLAYEVLGRLVLERASLIGGANGFHYSVSIHRQEAYRVLGYSTGDFLVAEAVAKEIVSLPIFPQLREGEIQGMLEIINHYAAAS